MERRKQRSENRSEALQMYLGHLARRCDAHGLVIADDAGLVVGGWGDADLDVLAANTVAPLLPANDAEVQALEFDGLTLRVSALHGAPLPTREVHAAVGRILDLAA